MIQELIYVQLLIVKILVIKDLNVHVHIMIQELIYVHFQLLIVLKKHLKKQFIVNNKI
jgi:hypothetical protein